MKTTLIVCLSLLTCLAEAQTPVADFTASKVSGCAALAVTFTDQSTGNPKYWTWDFGNGQLSTLQNPTVVYSTPGTYTVKLVVQNENGTNGITKTNYINVYPSPHAAFTADITTGCAPVAVQFSDQSTPAGTIASWQWDFGDGATSTQQNPRKTYTTTGFYSVSLTVVSNTGCQGVASKNRYVRIVSGVTPDFDHTDPATCRPPYSIGFTNLTSGPGNLTYQWNFGNGTSSTQVNPGANYSANGTYTVKLTARSDYGCVGSVQKDIPVTGSNTVIAAPDSVCLNTPVGFQNGSSPAPVSSLWNLGNGDTSSQLNASTSYGAAGIYPVKLVNTYNNCKDSATKNITVVNIPTVNFSATNNAACQAPLTVSFQDLSAGAVAWQWDFGDGGTSTLKAPTHQYTAPGRYKVTLTITSKAGCTNSLTKNNLVQILTPSIQKINLPDGVCVSTSFSASASINAPDGIASYLWDFGDGTTSTAATPSHSYATAANYTIKLTVTTKGGCTTSLTKGLPVGTPPTIDFSADNNDICASSTVNFTDLSVATGPVHNLNKWVWDFGDGDSSNAQNPAHHYSDTGYVDVTLTAYNNGCANKRTKPQFIHIKPPVAVFSAAVSCTNKREVTFTNTSIVDPAYGPVSYLWDFGNGVGSTAMDTTIIYSGTATGYSVKLKVTNGCTDSVIQSISLVNPTADFTVSKTTVCKNELVTFTAVSPPSEVTQYEWSLDGGASFVSGQSIRHGFPNNGPHKVTLTITDINGCMDTKTNNPAVTVIGPAAAFTAGSVGACKNAAVTFRDASTPAASLTQWQWDFGDGGSAANQNPSHTYADTGRYVVLLKVTDNNGCTDTVSQRNPVLITRPVAGFSADYPLVCPKSAVQFTPVSSGTRLSYQWDFGDGTGSNLPSPSHTYGGKDSTYTVKVVITDTVGCTDTLIKTGYITTRAPRPAFTDQDTASICPPLETSFFFGGQDYVSYYWDFGDGGTSTLQDPVHFYNSYGDYTAKLVLKGYGGCADSVSRGVHVYNPNTTTISYSPLNACNSLTVDFTVSTPPATSFDFYSGDGNVDSSQSLSFQHFYSKPAFYSPSLLLKDDVGCQSGVSGGKQIRILGAIPLFNADTRKFCDSGTVYFTNYTITNDPIVSSTWDFGDGVTSTDQSPRHYYTGPGLYTPTLSVTTQAGCSNTETDTIRVYRTPQPLIVGDSIACINTPFTQQGALVDADTSITWSWDMGNGIRSDQQNPPPVTYGQTGNFTVGLQATNLLGCTGNTSKTIDVKPLPVITVTDNPVIMVGTGTTLPVTYSSDVDQYLWTPDTHLSCTGCATPYANPQFTTTYNVAVESIYGCRSNADITVKVVCTDQNYFVPNTFSPNGDGVNDVFYPRGSALTRINHFAIFDRWGNLVFEKLNFKANDITAGWNGTYKGQPASPGVYVYIMDILCDNGTLVPVKGNITLIR